MGVMEDPVQAQDSIEALRRCQERFDRLVEIASEGYWEQDENYRFTLITGGALSKSAVNAGTYLGTARWDHGAVTLDPDGSWDRHKAVLQARQPFTDFIFKRPAANGDMHYISASGEPIVDQSGRLKGYRGVARDVTERVRTEQLQRLEHSVVRHIADAHSVTEGITTLIRTLCETESWECGRYFRCDEQAGVLRFSASWGVPEPEIQEFIECSRALVYKPGLGLMGRVWQSGQPLWVVDVNRDARALRGAFPKDIGIRGGFVFPVMAECKVVGTLAFNTRQLRNPDDRLMQSIHVVGSLIGQYLRRKEAEEELRRFRAAMDASSDLMLLVDRASLRYIDVNDAACRALGYTREELLAMGPQDIFSKSKGELVRLYDQMFAGDWVAPRYEGAYRCKDGSELTVEVYPRALRSTGEDVVVAIARDIRERKRAHRLSILEHTVALSLAEADSASATVMAAIRAVCESENWESGGYWRVDEAAGVLRSSDFWCAPHAVTEEFFQKNRGVTFLPGVGMVGHVWQSAQPLWVADINNDPHVLQTSLVRECGMGSACLFPVVSEGTVIGVLAFVSREIRKPDEQLLAAVWAIGSQIGQFVQRKLAEAALRVSEERFRSLTRLSSDVYWEQDEQYRFTSLAGTGADAVDGGNIEFIGKKHWEHEYLNMSAEAWAAHVAILDQRLQFHDLELCRLNETGAKVWASVSGAPVFDATGVFKGYRGVGKDITGRKQAEARIEHMANHDSLTALPNRTMFSAALHNTLQSARRYHRSFAVLFMDLDRFKVINDSLGHEAGDQLLQEVGRRLTQTVRASDIVARLGGDEFVVLVQEVTEVLQVEAVARKILSALTEPMSIQGQECRVTASIGICMYPSDAQDEHSLMKNADIAMYRAKEDGKNTYKLYSKDISSHSFERLALETSLRPGMERNEFFLHYQAKLDLTTREITGVEALVRWQHPDLGLVPPGGFIPLAEETGLIVPLGKWVLKTACVQNMAWQKSGLPPLRMAVNLSARQFADENLLGDIAVALQESAMPAELLELELTESMVMQNSERTAKLLTALKKLGVRLAIDDFGVGYSSLNHIKRFPIDTLKVDRSFIRNLPHDLADQAITKAIIAMGKGLNLTIVAEGVETLGQEEFLRDNACDESQGYYFSRPIASEQFAELLRKHLGQSG